MVIKRRMETVFVGGNVTDEETISLDHNSVLGLKTFKGCVCSAEEGLTSLDGVGH